jgi:hypothetical protein
MQSKQETLSNVIRLVTCAFLAVGLLARADDKKPDPSGTWSWTVPGRNGGPDRTNTLTLKIDGDKLTGVLTTPRRGGEKVDTAIQEGKATGSDISFTVTREFNGNTMTSKYSGKLSGDTIVGKMEFDRDGETQSRDWTATRQSVAATTPAAPAAPAAPDKTDSADKK